MPVFLAAVNDTLRRVGVLAGDITSFTSTGHIQHQIDIMVQLWREGLLELYAHGLLAKEGGIGAFHLASGTREYALMPDFERMAWPHVIRALPGFRLTYDPEVVCPLTLPNTYNVTGNQEIALAAGEHAVLVYPDEPINGYVHVAGVAGGTNRVRTVLGGSHRNWQEYDSASASGKYSTALRFQDIETAYVEGVFFNKGEYAGDCISFTANGSSPGGTLYVQHCRGTGINYKDTGQGDSITQHGDFIQITRQSTALRVDYCTADTRRQGILTNSALDDEFVSGAALLSGGVLRRVNINAYDSPTANRPLFYLQDSDSATPIQWTLDRCYMYDRNATPVTSLLRLVAPSTFFGQTTTSAETDGSSVSWPAATLISGSIPYGIPPGGDYVPSTFTGLGYSSPGYGTSIPPRGVHLEEYHGGYTQMLIEQALATQWTGQPHAFALSPCDDKIRIDREPTSDEAGSRYEYLYEKSLAFTSTMATQALPVTDDTYRAMVPYIAEWYERTQKKDFDSEAFSAGLARAVLDATRMPLKPSYGKHRRVR
jgi:hypothetical protein